jgi:hypothetical protein
LSRSGRGEFDELVGEDAGTGEERSVLAGQLLGVDAQPACRPA